MCNVSHGYLALDHINLNCLIIFLANMVFHSASISSAVMHRHIVEGKLVEEVF